MKTTTTTTTTKKIDLKKISKLILKELKEISRAASFAMNH